MSRRAAAVAALAGCLLGSASAAQNLKIATLAPDGTTWMTEMRGGAEEIARRTEGRVKLKFYPGGVMGNDKTVLRKIRAGQLQGGAFASGSLVEVDRDAIIYGLPFTFRSYDEVEYVRSRMDARLRDGLAAGGLVVLGIGDGGFGYLFSDRPLRSGDDLKGRKVWTPEGDEISRTVLAAAGVTPVVLPLSDVYTGLQTGLVDSVTSTPAATIALQWHTRVKHMADVPLVYLIGVLAVDRGAFQALAPGDRTAVLEVMAEAFARMDRQGRKDNEASRQALAKQGVRFDVPSAEEMERWHAIARDATERLRSAGTFTEESFALLQRLLAEHRAGGAGAGGR